MTIDAEILELKEYLDSSDVDYTISPHDLRAFLELICKYLEKIASK